MTKIRIASVRKFSILILYMKAFFVAVIFLAVAVSVHAQEQILVSGADVYTAFPGSQYFGNQAVEGCMITAPRIPTLSPLGMGAASQTSSLAIQAVPEPDSFALLLFGVLAGVSVLRRSPIRSLTLN